MLKPNTNRCKIKELFLFNFLYQIPIPKLLDKLETQVGVIREKDVKSGSIDFALEWNLRYDRYYRNKTSIQPINNSFRNLTIISNLIKTITNSPTWLVISSPIWALIGQCTCHACNWTVYASCLCKWTVRVILRALLLCICWVDCYVFSVRRDYSTEGYFLSQILS